MGGVESHMQSLKERHAELEKRISEEMKRPQPDSTTISVLKKHKLRIKQEIDLMLE